MNLMYNTSKIRQDVQYKQAEYDRLVKKANGENTETLLHAGMHDGEEKTSISLDSLSPLPKCPQCGAKLKNRAKKCNECGYKL